MKLMQPRLPWETHALLPADVGNELCEVMLSRENLLEDVHYQKVAPNRFRVELNQENYARNFQPLKPRILQQWHTRLVEHLATANSRLGRKQYVIAGSVQIEVIPVTDLKSNQARIYSQIRPDQPAQPAPQQPARRAGGELPGPRPTGPAPVPAPQVQPLNAHLEQVPGGRRWALYPGVMTIGRQETCDIHLDLPAVHEHRLISSQHAYLHCDPQHIRLFDGTPGGRPSLNGTYVNRRRVFAEGFELREGDLITLAAANPQDPRPDAPGVVSFRFHRP
jgi:hypothetical protein